MHTITAEIVTCLLVSSPTASCGRKRSDVFAALTRARSQHSQYRATSACVARCCPWLRVHVQSLPPYSVDIRTRASFRIMGVTVVIYDRWDTRLIFRLFRVALSGVGDVCALVITTFLRCMQLVRQYTLQFWTPQNTRLEQHRISTVLCSTTHAYSQQYLNVYPT